MDQPEKGHKTNNQLQEFWLTYETQSAQRQFITSINVLDSLQIQKLCTKSSNYYYIKLSTYKRIIWYYPSGWAHAPRISYPQSRDTGAACQVASHSKHGEQVKNSSLMCVSFAQIAQTNLSHSPHSNSFSSILIFPSQILQILVLGFCL